MQNPFFNVFDKLNDYSNTMKLRKEAYEHASQLTGMGIEDKKILQGCACESEKSIELLDNQIDNIALHLRGVEKRKYPPLKCSLYYAMAKSTSNFLTVCLSLQLGDLWFYKNHEEFISQIDQTVMKNFKEEIQKYLNCLKRGYNYANFNHFANCDIS